MSQSAATADPNAIATTNDAPSQPENADVVVQYVVLRRDLIDTWPLGSVVTQGCHASVSAVWSNKEDPFTVDYCSPDKIDSMHKSGFGPFGWCIWPGTNVLDCYWPTAYLLNLRFFIFKIDEDSSLHVTLEVKGEPQIKNLSEKLTAGGIIHKLWIEQPENIPTCLATKPYPKSSVSSYFKKLKLCK
ncbi:hypothetical protein JHK85_009604 [Glycine max]|nr:hypothetical protein JHK85_009604 [Glycine max]